MLLFGIMEFGRAYNTQLTLTNAAREGVRVMAIDNNATTALAATTSSADTLTPALRGTDVIIAFQTIPPTTPAPTQCAPGRQVTVTINYTLNTMTGIAGPFTMRGRGTMLCGG
jgi:Flp pilus assembly protein TadG